MIEAVNSVLSNAQLLRASTEQVDSSRTPALDLSSAEINIPQAPFVSPYISIDRNYNKAVLQIRDSDTGDVLRQFPSQSRLEQQQKAAQADRAAATFVYRKPEDSSAKPVVQAQVHEFSGASQSAEPSAAPDVAQAQLASAALAAGARVGVANLSAGVNVQA